jgi:AraC-like DNA-binding protein
MNFTLLDIVPQLQEFVTKAYRVTRDEHEALSFKLLPRLYPVFFFLFEDMDLMTSKTSSKCYDYRPCNIYFGGVGNIPMEFILPSKLDFIMVLPKPHTTGMFMSDDASHFIDHNNLIMDRGQFERIANDKINSAKTIGDKWVCIQQYLLKIIRNPPYNLQYVMRALELIRKRSGALHIYSLAKSSWTSQRNLLDSFRQHVGISPKQFASNVRFNALFCEYHTNSKLTLLYYALKHKYYDVSHVYKDFERYLNETPHNFPIRDQEINHQLFGDFLGHLDTTPGK